MEESNKSEEELAAEKKAAETEVKEEDVKTSETETEETEEEESSEEEAPLTVPLSDHTRTKDVLHRVADRIIEDDESLADLAENDPKLLERLKKEFPKKFKDIKIPEASMSQEDIDARIKSAVAKELKGLGKSEVLDALREEIGMTKLEFQDIKSSVAEKADRLENLELADSYKDAVLLAYKDLSPKKYKELISKQAAKESADKYAKGTSGKGSETKKYSKKVLDNYKKYGFDNPEQMVKYQDESQQISLSI